MHTHFPKHSCMGRARMKSNKETEKDFKKRGASMERSKACMKENRSPDGLN